MELIATPATPVTPPTVTSLQRFGFHAQPTDFVLTFSSALDPTRAQDPLNYTLRQIAPNGHLGARIRIAAAVYNPLTKTVTLHPAHRVYLFARYKLVVNGMPPVGVASPSGVLLDGQGNGIPGSDYVKIFGRSILAGRASRFGPIKITTHEIRHISSERKDVSARHPRLRTIARVMHGESAHTSLAQTGPGRLSTAAVDAALAQVARLLPE